MKKTWISFVLILLTHIMFAQNRDYLLVGTYTGTGSKGIYVYRFNTADASVKIVDSIEASNPSYLAVAPGGNYVYAVNEDADSTNIRGGNISAFSFNKKTGKLKFINQVSSWGKYPCYITTDNTGKWVIAANYGTGNSSIHPTGTGGKIMSSIGINSETGSGPNLPRQSGAHAHAAVLSKDNRMLYITDLGTDEIVCLPFNTKTGRTDNPRGSSVTVSPGSGPRHLTFHPNNKYAYLVLELTASVNVYKNTNNRLTEVQSISALPLTYKGEANSADIHVAPDGKFLYVSNRGGSNTIAIFKIDPKDGTLTIVGHQYTMGNKPRNFNFDPTGKYLLVGNQDSDEIVIFKRNTTTGLLTDTGKRIKVPKPVCIKWVKG